MPETQHGSFAPADNCLFKDRLTSRPFSDGSGRRLLAIFFDLPASLEKNAQMLLLKHLARVGWSVTVLTVRTSTQKTLPQKWNDVRILEVRPRSLRWRWLEFFYRVRSRLSRRMINLLDRVIRPLNATLSFPDRFACIKRQVAGHAKRLHRQQSFDALASLYHPITSHLIAGSVASCTGIPWIALHKDYYSWPDTMLNGRADRLVNRWKRHQEVRSLGHAHLVAPVNDNISKYLSDHLDGPAIQTLAHCYDEENFPSPFPTSDRPTFVLTSVGKVDRSEEPALRDFFAALADLQSEGRIDAVGFRVRFVGYGGDIVGNLASRAGCEDVVEVVAQMPHAEAMEALHGATCLLFQQAPWASRRRLPEYFAARRPILAFPHYPGVMSERLLREYGAAQIAGDRESIKAAILKWYREFLQTGRIDVSVNEELVQSFSASKRAEELDGMLRKLVASC